MTETRQNIIDRATIQQQRAADPKNSVWVSANAGTGKTRVLTMRILRILLDGARVSEIMGVTYTRAAAAEMRNRIFDTLSRWTVIDETDLREEIIALGIDRPSQKQISTARSLFARLLDAPMAIRIETVHAFCQSVLRRFPFEAEIQPYFELATDLQAKTLNDEAIQDVLRSEEPDIRAALARIAESIAENNLMKPVVELSKYENVIAGILQNPAAMKRDVFDALGCVDAADDPEAALEALQDAIITIPDEAAIWRFAEKWQEGTATEQKNGKALQAWLEGDISKRRRRTQDYINTFLNQDMNVRVKIPTKALKEQYPDLEDIFAKEGARLKEIKAAIRAIETASLTSALYLIAGRIHTGYQKRKVIAGLMDYNDLINEAAALLNQDGGASWVRYKLDEGITHLLVDEAQDTSPRQWQILASLAREFFTGDETDEKDRSIFSVGDFKQSIYSFQGARPELFSAQRDRFKEMAHQANKPFDQVDLDTSFRTTKPILNIVDDVIKPDGVPMPGIGDSVAHAVSRIGDAGFVEVLDAEPFIIKAESEQTAFIPFEGGDAVSAEELMAKRITTMLKNWIGVKEIPSKGRAMQAGDVMILVRNRKGFAKRLDRELRRAGLPVAGADRVMLTADIAVMDLLALGEVVLLPEDDLTLAAVLKSPLFGLDEDAIYTLAHGRGEETIQKRLATFAATDSRFTEAHRRLTEWLGLSEITTPSQFYRAVLTADMMQAFVSRLGTPVLDVLAEFLAIARDFEEVNPASLQRFIASVRISEMEIKREAALTEADEIRIMTMHGAKGLEAPIVILPHMMKQRSKSPILVDVPVADRSLPIVPPSGKFQVTAVIEAIDGYKRAEQNEENRLLYVGMTRAEDGLVIAGFAAHENALEGSFYQQIRSAVEANDHHTRNDGDDGIKIETAQEARIKKSTKATPAPQVIARPAWLDNPAPPEETPPRPLSPSRYAAVPSAHSPTGQDRKKAMLRGSLTHRLLEVLPGLDQDARVRAAARIITPAVGASGLSQNDADMALKETLTLLDDASLADIFGAGSRAEVPISGIIGHEVVSGVIDRLVITDDQITIIDFKTGQSPKNGQPIAVSYIAQQGIYVHVLRQIWPDRPVKAGLIYTEDASLHWLDDAEMAMKIAPLLDG